MKIMALFFSLNAALAANDQICFPDKKRTKEYTTAVKSGGACFAFLSFREFCELYPTGSVPPHIIEKKLQELIAATNLSNIAEADDDFLIHLTEEQKERLISHVLSYAGESENLVEIKEIYRFLELHSPRRAYSLKHYLIEKTLESQDALVIASVLSALKEHEEDTPDLFEHFLDQIAPGITPLFDIIGTLGRMDYKEKIAQIIIEQANGPEEKEIAYKELVNELGEEHPLLKNLKTPT